MEELKLILELGDNASALAWVYILGHLFLKGALIGLIIYGARALFTYIKNLDQ